MKNKFSYIIFLLVCMFSFNSFAIASCKDYGNSGHDACVSQSEDGFKCIYNASRKGAARCYKSSDPASDVVITPATPEPITSEASTNSTSESTSSTGEKTCNMYASSGKDFCESQSYGGYKCHWDINKKGGARCFKSKELTDEKINEIANQVNSCFDIKEGSEICNASKVKGIQCAFKQGVCTNKTDSDGSGETIIGSTAVTTLATTSPATTTATNRASDEIEYIGDNFCETKGVLSVMRMVGYVLTLLKVFVPIIIIVWGTLKLYNVVISGTTDSLNKQIKNLVYRIIIGICIFFVPTLVDAVLKNFIPEDAIKCETCVLKPFSCNPSAPSSITNDKTTTTTKYINPKCSSRGESQSMCESAPGNGCYWDSASTDGNKCKYRTKEDKCTDECSSFAQGTKDHYTCKNECFYK